jgi:hypothetical protein
VPQGSTYLVDDKLYSSALPYICHVCSQPYRRADALTHRQQFGHWPHEFGATEREVVLEKVRKILAW